MRHGAKRILSLLLTVAMVFGMAVIPSAAAGQPDNVVSIKETAVNAAGGIYKLEVSARTNYGVSQLDFIMSYDNTIVTPISAEDAKTEIDWSSNKSTVFERTGSPVSLIGKYWMPTSLGVKLDGNRTYFNVGAADSGVAASTETVHIMDFYYKVSDADKMDAQTFSVARDWSDGSIMHDFYPGEGLGAGVLITTAKVSEEGQDTTYSYTWGNKDGSDDQIAVDLAYTNSDKKLKPSYPVNEAKNAAYGQMLADVPFDAVTGTEYTPGSFAWEDPTLSVGEAGTNKFYAVYTPDDASRYETITGIEVAVIVAKAKFGEVIEKTTYVASNTNGETGVKEYTYNLNELTAGLEGFKDMSFTLGSTADDSNLLSGEPTLSGSVVSFKANAMAKGTAASVAVTIQSKNYEDAAAVLVIEAADKKPSEITVTQTGGTYGSAIANPKASASPTAANGSWSYLYQGTTANGDAYSSSDAPREAGTYTVTATYSDDEYYGTKESVSFTIAPKKVTAAVKAASREYGAANPEFDVVCSGLAYEDTAADLKLNLSSSAAAADAPGSYAVTGTAANKNYDVTVDGAGKLTVTKAKISAIAEKNPADVVILANDPANKDAASLLALVGPKTTGATYAGGTANLDITWKLSSGTFNVKGGTYTYAGTVAGGANFDISKVTPLTAKVTVTPVTGTINGVSTAKKYVVNTLENWTHTGFGLPASVQVTYDNGVQGSTVNVTWTPAASTLSKKVGAEKTFTIENGAFPAWATIEPVSVPVAVTDKYPVKLEVKAPADITYGQTLGTAVVTPVAIDNGLDADASIEITYSGKALDGTVVSESKDKPVKAGTYTVTAAYVSKTHTGEGSGIVTINPKGLTVTAECGGKIYDAATTAAITFGALNKAEVVGEDTPAIVGGKASYDSANAGTRTVTVTGYSIDNKNYVPANDTVTINNVTISKAAPKITLGNLSQSQNSAGGGITSVTTILFPNSPTAVPTVEYYVVKTATQAAVATVPAVACNHTPGTEPCTAVTGGACDHTDGCTYAAEIPAKPEVPAEFEWTAALPTAVGSYPVRAYLPVGDDNLNAIAEADAEKGTLVIKAYSKSHGGGGGGGGGSAATPTPSTSDDKITVSTSTAAKTESAGKAAASVSESQMNTSLKKAQDALEAAKKNGGAQKAEMKIAVSGGTGSNEIETSIPAASVKAVAENGKISLTLETAVANVTLDEKTLSAVSKEAAGSDIKITAAKIDKSKLSLFERLITLTRPVYEFSVVSGGKEISEFSGGQATITLPYTLAAGEKAEGIRVFYVDSDGNLSVVKNVSYDEKAKAVSFTTSHFSYYAIGYETVSFSDVTAGSWYYTPVMYLAENEIVKGKSASRFGAEDNITRAEFVQILYNQNGAPKAETSGKFSDVASDAWYANAVNWAAENGIAAGASGKFNPNANITRQELTVMLSNYYKFKGKEVSGDQAALSKFADSASVAAWAKSGVAFCSGEGLVSGYEDGTFRPANTATRAEAAQMITSMLLKLK